MSNSASWKIKNEPLFSKCNQLLRKALLFLGPICGREIIELIESKPAEHHRQYYHLLNAEPDFYPFLDQHQERIKNLSEFQQCNIIMHQDPVVSKHLDTLVGSTVSSTHMEAWDYIAHILRRLLTKYFIYGNDFDEVLYRKLYSDLEALFYNKEIPMKAIAPLLHFESEVDQINLHNGLSIEKITPCERKHLLKMLKHVNLRWSDFSQFEYAIKYSYPDKKIVGVSSSNDSIYEQIYQVLRNTISVSRLFKPGTIGASYVLLYPVLDTAINVENIITSNQPEITYGMNYKLTAQEITPFFKLWERLKPMNFVKMHSNNNIILALRRFNSSFNRATNEDKFIDLAICYEALFSKEDDTSDSITHKLALRYARLISSDFKERIDYCKKMKDLYNERSTIMHGKTLKKGSYSHAKIENNLRKSIIAYLDRYKPNITHKDIIDEIEFNCPSLTQEPK
jgi:hypothetical protein